MSLHYRVNIRHFCDYTLASSLCYLYMNVYKISEEFSGWHIRCWTQIPRLQWW